MNLLERFFLPQPLRQQRLEERQIKQAGTLERVGVQGRAAPVEVNLAALNRAYSRNEIVYAALQAKATAAIDPRLIVQNRTGDDSEWEEVKGHPLKRVMMRPTDQIDGPQFLQAAIISWDVARRFYAEKLRNGAGAVVGLNPLDPTRIRKTKEGNYEWGNGRDKVVFKPEDLLIREPLSWVEPSPVAVCLGSVDADSAQTDYIRSFFNNGGVPSGVLTSDQDLTEEDAEEYRGRWRALFSRGGRQHDIAVLGRGTNYTRMGSNLAELQGDALREFVETRVAMTLGVPPLVIYAFAGLRRATYSNLKEAHSSWWDNQLSPMFKQWLSWLQWSLLTEFEDIERVYSERVRLSWDLSDVAALQEDVDAKHTRAEKAFRAGGITLNEYREQLGEAPDNQGDYYVRPLSAMAVPAGTMPVAEEPLPAKRARLMRELKAAGLGTIEKQVERIARAALLDQYQTAATTIRELGD